WSELVRQVAFVLLALGLLQLVAERTNRRFDLTPGRSLSLSSVTRKLLAQVTVPLKVTVFFRRGTREQYADLLERFRAANPHVAFELYDLDRFPERGRSLGVEQYGRAAIEYEGRRVVVLASPEEQLAGGILRALRAKRRRLVFTTGHGERGPSGAADSYGRLLSALEAENYAPEDVSLLDDPVPRDTALVVVAGPKHDFLPLELHALAPYLKAGGGGLLLLDPGSFPNIPRLPACMGGRPGVALVVGRVRRRGRALQAGKSGLRSGGESDRIRGRAPFGPDGRRHRRGAGCGGREHRAHDIGCVDDGGSGARAAGGGALTRRARHTWLGVRRGHGGDLRGGWRHGPSARARGRRRRRRLRERRLSRPAREPRPRPQCDRVAGGGGGADGSAHEARPRGRAAAVAPRAHRAAGAGRLRHQRADRAGARPRRGAGG